MNLWLTHLKKYQRDHPHLTLKESMERASKSYHGSGLRQSRVERFSSFEKVKKGVKKPKSQNLQQLTNSMGINRYGLKELAKYYSNSNKSKSGRGLRRSNNRIEAIKPDDEKIGDENTNSRGLSRLTGRKYVEPKPKKEKLIPHPPNYPRPSNQRVRKLVTHIRSF